METLVETTGTRKCPTACSAIKRHLNWMRWLGHLPHDWVDGNLKTTAWGILRCVVAELLSCSISAASFLITFWKIPDRNIFGVLSPDFMRKAYNFTRTDFIINYCVIAFPTLTLIALTHSGRSFQKIGHLVKTNCYRIRKRNALIATLFLCCHTVGLACYTLFFMRLSSLLADLNWSEFLVQLMTISCTVYAFKTGLFFVMSSTLLTGILEKWIEIGDGLDHDVDDKILPNLQNWIHQYEVVQDTFSTFLFWEFVLDILMLVTYTYQLLTTIAEMALYTKVNLALLPLASRFILFVATIIRLCFITFSCDRAHRIIKMKADQFFKKSLEASDDVTCKLHRSCAELLSRARPLNGCGFFEIRRRILTALTGTVATYMIVMLQFKASDVEER